MMWSELLFFSFLYHVDFNVSFAMGNFCFFFHLRVLLMGRFNGIPVMYCHVALAVIGEEKAKPSQPRHPHQASNAAHPHTLDHRTMPASKKITRKPDEIAAFLDRFDVSSVILLRAFSS
jgi:hypothetical protein